MSVLKLAPFLNYELTIIIEHYLILKILRSLIIKLLYNNSALSRTYSYLLG